MAAQKIDSNEWGAVYGFSMPLLPWPKFQTTTERIQLIFEQNPAGYNEIKKELREIREMIAKLSNAIGYDDNDIIELRDITHDQAKKEIADYFSAHHGENINSFQISVDLRIDEDVVDEICEELLEEGRIAEAK
ncbi:MAG: hypothetical protein KBG09_07595 [Syntrophobacterales bacterium]|jgi:hypothetical protein|nr:hypothetical protein [Syntrophobacterales bacterium]